MVNCFENYPSLRLGLLDESISGDGDDNWEDATNKVRSSREGIVVASLVDRACSELNALCQGETCALTQTKGRLGKGGAGTDDAEVIFLVTTTSAVVFEDAAPIVIDVETGNEWQDCKRGAEIDILN